MQMRHESSGSACFLTQQCRVQFLVGRLMAQQEQRKGVRVVCSGRVGGRSKKAQRAGEQDVHEHSELPVLAAQASGTP